MNLEIYPIRLLNQNMIYAPTARKAAFVNDDACHIIELCRDGLLSIDEPIVKELFSSFGISTESALHSPVSQEHNSNEEWAPSEVTLSITSRCSLRCIYCYANGGEELNDMPWPIARNAMDWAINNAKTIKKQSAFLHFHGEGEPTARWDFFVECVEYFRNRCQEEEMKSVISMSSNCYLSSQQREYVISHLDTISASFDGTPLLQDMQRPCLGGHTSSVRVIETLKELDRKRFCYAIRATVLPEMFEKGMVDSVCWIADNLPNCDQVRFEPVQPQGRGANFKGSLDPFAFLEGFRNARKEGAKRGINVDYSVCRSSHFKSSFCGALGTELNVLVTTKGIITTCNDVLKPDHEKAAVFHIGVIGAAKDEIGIDGDKLNWLRNLSVQDFSTCYKCFARWHCAGDCFGRKPGAINKEQPCELNLFRCTINRELILDDIFLLAIDQNQRIDNEPIERLSNIGG